MLGSLYAAINIMKMMKYLKSSKISLIEIEYPSKEIPKNNKETEWKNTVKQNITNRNENVFGNLIFRTLARCAKQINMIKKSNNLPPMLSETTGGKGLPGYNLKRLR